MERSMDKIASIFESAQVRLRSILDGSNADKLVLVPKKMIEIYVIPNMKEFKLVDDKIVCSNGNGFHWEIELGVNCESFYHWFKKSRNFEAIDRDFIPDSKLLEEYAIEHLEDWNYKREQND